MPADLIYVYYVCECTTYSNVSAPRLWKLTFITHIYFCLFINKIIFKPIHKICHLLTLVLFQKKISQIKNLLIPVGRVVRFSSLASGQIGLMFAHRWSLQIGWKWRHFWRRRFRKSWLFRLQLPHSLHCRGVCPSYSRNIKDIVSQKRGGSRRVPFESLWLSLQSQMFFRHTFRANLTM